MLAKDVSDLNAYMQIYGFFATAFYEPKVETSKCFTDIEYWKELKLAFSRLCGAEEELLEELEEVLLKHYQKGEQTLDELFLKLRIEYNRLFIGPAPPPCPPYESVYSKSQPKEQKGTVYGPPALEMEKALREEGLEITLDHTQLADHIGIELEFMYYLLDKALSSPEEFGVYIEKGNEFFKKHLAEWLPEFGEKLAKEARHPFYGEVGKLLTKFIRFSERRIYP